MTAERLRSWAVQELNLVSEGSLHNIPSVESFKMLTEDKHTKKLWTYVVNHVRSQATVNKIKRILRLKKLREEKDEIFTFNEVDASIAELKAAVSKTSEKRMFLTREVSVMEERIFSLEQTIVKVNEETNRINHRAAFLELLKKKYNEKDALLKILSAQLSFHIDYLCTYKSPFTLNQFDLSSSYEFLFNKLSDGTYFKLLSTAFAIIEMELTQSDGSKAVLFENLQKQNYDLKKTGFRLIDLVAFLKCMSFSDIEHFYALSSQNVSIKDFMLNVKKIDSVKLLLSQKQYSNVQDALCALRNRKKINKLLLDKNLAFKNKIESLESVGDVYFELKISLLEKLLENDALIISNNCLEENLKIISCKSEALEQDCEGLQNEVTALVKKYYKNADLAFYLSNSAQGVFQKILDELNSLHSFAHNELFVFQLLPHKDQLEEMKTSLILDRKIIWDYCEKTNMIEPFCSKPYKIDYPLSSEARKLLFFSQFENTGTILRKWAGFKETLKSQAMAVSQPHMQPDIVSTTEIYMTIMKMLDKIKISIEEGISSINDGVLCCNKNATLIQEWWEQNAQFIPPIEYEGKTLKMWIDIIDVLTEFEPNNLENC